MKVVAKNAGFVTIDIVFIDDEELGQIEQVYKEKFNDTSDFTFYFVGNISKEEFLPYLEKYFASIP